MHWELNQIPDWIFKNPFQRLALSKRYWKLNKSSDQYCNLKERNEEEDKNKFQHLGPENAVGIK